MRSLSPKATPLQMGHRRGRVKGDVVCSAFRTNMNGAPSHWDDVDEVVAVRVDLSGPEYVSVVGADTKTL